MLVVYKYNDKEYKVQIEKKKTTKNLYIRVKEDLTIYVTCHTRTSDALIQKTILDNQKAIEKMITRREKLQKEKEYFYFLGKRYDIVYNNQVDIQFGENKVFLSHDFDLDKWLKKQALALFRTHLEYCYASFSRTIPKPSLRIRKMKTRWGVCNTRDKIITLNLELIKKDVKYLDYVIYHELSHLVYPNHSTNFWKVVEENCKDCKKFRKELNE